MGFIQAVKNSPRFSWYFLIGTMLTFGGAALVIKTNLPLKEKITIIIMCIIIQAFNHYLYKKRLKEWDSKKQTIDKQLEEMYKIKFIKP